METIVLVDVSAMYFRAFYAIRALSNSQGMPTNALYGFSSMTLKLFQTFNPKYIAYCFDRKDPSFRKQLYDGYKANRSEMPADLIPQVPYVERIAKAFGIPCFELKDYEADDIIGMATKLGQIYGCKIVIVSGDKDFAQLVNDNVELYDTMKDIHYGPKEVVEKWGVPPEQMRDYLALVGDSSDNIPGVRGIGPKGAVKLLEEFGSLEGIYNRIDDVKNVKLREKLASEKEMAFLSQKLVTIVTENHLGIQDLKAFERGPIQEEDLKALFNELEFHTMLRKILPGEGGPEPEKPKKAAKAPKTAVTKTASGGEPKGKLPYLEFSALAKPFEPVVQSVNINVLKEKLQDNDLIWVLEVAGRYAFAKGTEVFTIEKEEEGLRELLEAKKLRWKGHDIKNMWRELGIAPGKGVAISDSMLAMYVFTSMSVGTFQELSSQVFIEDKPDYDNAADVYLAHLYVENLLNEELENSAQHKIYTDIEMAVLPILHAVEYKGITLDTKILSEQRENLLQLIERLQKEIFAEMGHEFNLDSPKQLAQVLYEKLKVPALKKTKTGYSTDSDVLEKLATDYPYTGKIIEYREYKKLLSTYIDALPKLVKADGRVHTHYNQAVAATGRLSSTNPNLQNIPIRTEAGNAIRKAFVAAPGTLLVSADYSQIELRVLAHITSDPALLKAFKDDIDIHTLTASEVFGVELKEVDAEMRRQAKAVNFGIAYGMGAYSLAENLRIPRAHAKEIIERYFARFVKVKDYMQTAIQEARDKNYADSIFGRRRYIPELLSGNNAVAKFGERIAINSPIQSTASDIVKKAMIEVANIKHAPILLQVHDELVFEIEESLVETKAKEIQTVMQDAVELKVPLKVNVGWAKDWKDAH